MTVTDQTKLNTADHSACFFSALTRLEDAAARARDAFTLEDWSTGRLVYLRRQLAHCSQALGDARCILALADLARPDPPAETKKHP